MEILNKYKKIKNNFDFIKFATQIADCYCPLRGTYQKYNNKYFLICLTDFINTSTNWTKYKGTIEYPINGKYLNQIHNKYIKNGVYDQINKQLLDRYLKTDKEIKLKYQSIDSSFIPNKRGSVKDKNNNKLLNANVKDKNKIIEMENKKIKKGGKKKKGNIY